MNSLAEISKILQETRPAMASLAYAIRVSRPRVALCEDFTITVQDVEVCVQGEYQPREYDTGTFESYSARRIWIPTDLQAVNIIDFFSAETIARIEDEGRSILSERME